MKMALQGTIVPMQKSSPRKHFKGRIYFTEDGLVKAVKKTNQAAPAGYANTPVVDVKDSFIYPGLIDLHSHIAYNALPLWHREEESTPYLHHDIWPGRSGYRESVGWPAWLLARGAPEALMVYVQVQALAGGTTSIQGWPTFNRRPANPLVRNIDDQSFNDVFEGKDNIVTSTLTLDNQDLANRSRKLDEGKGFIYHCAEGQKNSRVVKEFDALGTTNCLREKLIAIHCCAVDEQAFIKWKSRAENTNNEKPGAVVWSPFSNLWLYGSDQTTDVPAALKHGITVCLGTDWGPSGTKNLLGELKAAQLCAQQLNWNLTEFDLVKMVTSSPGDMLERCWGKKVGRLTSQALADVIVVSRTSDDPWVNLVNAHEEQIQLALISGKPKYGTKSLMQAFSAGTTTSVRVGQQRRRVALIHPEDKDLPAEQQRSWTWSKAMDDLERVRANPTLDFVTTASANAGAANTMAQSFADLIIELDMPGALGMVAGPPPADVEVDIKPIPSLRHDRNWRRDVRQGGFHQGIFDELEKYY